MFATVSVTTDAVPLPLCLDPGPALPADPFAPCCLLVSAAQPAPAPARRLDIARHFAELPDPRHPAFRRYHRLDDILVLALTAMLCGCQSWEAIADFGKTKEAWFRCIGLELPHGIPSHDTFNRVFAALDPVAFQNAFTSWINAVCSSLGFCHIPIDGKAARGSRGPDGTCLHLVSAWAHEQRLSLAQVAVADKSNEITAIPKLLKLLDVHGALVSIDAMGCQKEIAKEIRKGGGDYLLALKENQPGLYADVVACFEACFEGDFQGVSYDVSYSEETSHGRYEERQCMVIYDPAGLSSKGEWEDLNAVVQVVRTRRQGGKQSTETSYYITSSRAAAKLLSAGVRAHWGIENGQHWVLDVVFGEDGCRSRQGHAAQNLAWLRKMALSVFNQDESPGSIPTRQIRAASSDEYRLHLLHLLGK